MLRLIKIKEGLTFLLCLLLKQVRPSPEAHRETQLQSGLPLQPDQVPQMLLWFDAQVLQNRPLGASDLSNNLNRSELLRMT